MADPISLNENRLYSLKARTIIKLFGFPRKLRKNPAWWYFWLLLHQTCACVFLFCFCLFVFGFLHQNACTVVLSTEDRSRSLGSGHKANTNYALVSGNWQKRELKNAVNEVDGVLYWSMSSHHQRMDCMLTQKRNPQCKVDKTPCNGWLHTHIWSSCAQARQLPCPLWYSWCSFRGILSCVPCKNQLYRNKT